MKLVLSLAAALIPGMLWSQARPNVIVLMTDDQGYGDLSCHGNPVLRTPNLDRLHDAAVRFTGFHVAPMCTPTRGQFLTGLDAARNGAINVSSGRALLRAELPTLANVFQDNGYRTGIFGKWHLGDSYPYRPHDRGFEEALWFPSSHINSVPDFWDNDYFNDTYRRNDDLVPYDGYCTDVFFREAMRWMQDSIVAGEPFFAYLPTNAPHSPHWVPESYREAVTERLARAAADLPPLPQGQRDELTRFLAMIENIDENVGLLESFLRRMGESENTIFVFLTDNGSTFGESYFNAGMRGRKTELWEGGHRVPCFIRWPRGGFQAPRDIDGLAQVQDLFPTLADLCGLETPADFRSDGISLAPALRGTATLPHDRMLVINYSRMPHGFDFPSPLSPSRMRRDGAAVLWQHWRLLGEEELYDLESDPLQQSNVIANYPIVAARMLSHLRLWWDRVEPNANEPQPVVIGAPEENPTLLTACEWLDVFVDQQRQVRRANRKNGYWHIEVAEAGDYEFALRRWPRESALPLSAGLTATPVEDGMLEPGVALPITSARIQIGDIRRAASVSPEDTAATFTISLPTGPTILHTWFDGPDRQPICGAYYVDVTRLSSDPL